MTIESRVLIEQAKGVLAELGNMDPDDAFAVLRTYARKNDLSVARAAEDVVEASRLLHPISGSPIMSEHRTRR